MECRATCSDEATAVQERNGWDILKALAAIKMEYRHDLVTIKAATAVEKRLRMARSCVLAAPCTTCGDGHAQILCRRHNYTTVSFLP